MSNLFLRVDDGAIFQPSGLWEVEAMNDLLKIEEGDHAVDLGSGDGRVVIDMAKRGAYAFGFEKEPSLIELSRENIKQEKLRDKAFVFLINFWDIKLSSFNKIAIFQVGFIMRRLQEKLAIEVHPGTLIVSHHWKFPNWEPIDRVSDIYLYRKV